MPFEEFHLPDFASFLVLKRRSFWFGVPAPPFITPRRCVCIEALGSDEQKKKKENGAAAVSHEHIKKEKKSDFLSESEL